VRDLVIDDTVAAGVAANLHGHEEPAAGAGEKADQLPPRAPKTVLRTGANAGSPSKTKIVVGTADSVRSAMM
jgi:hypothetical protein